MYWLIIVDKQIDCLTSLESDSSVLYMAYKIDDACINNNTSRQFTLKKHLTKTFLCYKKTLNRRYKCLINGFITFIK